MGHAAYPPRDTCEFWKLVPMGCGRCLRAFQNRVPAVVPESAAQPPEGLAGDGARVELREVWVCLGRGAISSTGRSLPSARPPASLQTGVFRELSCSHASREAQTTVHLRSQGPGLCRCDLTWTVWELIRHSPAKACDLSSLRWATCPSWAPHFGVPAG